MTGKHRILVADDYLDTAESMALVFKIMGNDVRTAKDGREAVEMAKEFQPELILMDISMPELNGYDACRTIRELPGGEDIVIVALTGWSQDEYKSQSQDAGFDQHLVKPVKPQVLEQLVAGLQTTPVKSANSFG